MMPAFSLDLPTRVLVGGAAGGIGGAVARKLQAAGAAVVGTDREGAPPGWKGIWTIGDLADATSYAAIADAAGEGLDGVVLAAGVLDSADWDAITPDDALRLININLVAPYFLLRALLPKLAASSSVVIVGSIAGLRASPATPFYAASKAGLRNLASSLALLLRPRGVRVNVVAPGLIDTPLTDTLNGTLAERRGLSIDAIVAERAAAIPIGRAGTADEVADTCLYLLSRQSTYMTGSTLFSTGGVLAGTT
jgi:NAD(P)-dependent dehydrogenase (short-subunit alcohol dehydrogenase family)